MGGIPGGCFCFPDLGTTRVSQLRGWFEELSPSHTPLSGVGENVQRPLWSPQAPHSYSEEATSGSWDGTARPGGCVTGAAGVRGPESVAATLGSARGC